MPLIADRFLVDDDGVVDLATGESVRLSIERGSAVDRARVDACDRLFTLRHPLLLPLVDYGAYGEHWFEAHANLGALRVPEGAARDTALHLVRFLRSAGVAFDSAAAARNVRPATEGGAAGWRPVGVSLQPTRAMEAVRTVLEANARPGVMAIGVHCAAGFGLRTIRLQIARLARQAGFVVIDSRFGALDEVFDPPRHLCVIDWLSGSAALPSALALAGADGARRHAWIRFSRRPTGGPGSIGLEPFMTRDLANAIYLDVDLGPSLAELRCALATSAGNPGSLVKTLASVRGAQVGWVHETAPEYVVPLVQRATLERVPSGGVTRLLRAAEAAEALIARGRHARGARVLERCASGLAARGEVAAAIRLSLVLGNLHVSRGRPAEAVRVFSRACKWDAQAGRATALLAGIGYARMELGQLAEAESGFRSALAGGGIDRPDGPQTCAIAAHQASPGSDPARRARRGLAEVLLLQGRLDQSEAMAGDDPLLLAIVRRHQGNVAQAARLAARALSSAPPGDHAAICEAQLESMMIQGLLGDTAAARRHADAARAAARLAASPLLRMRVAAECFACFENAGASAPRERRARLLAAASRLPALTAARVRVALSSATAADRAIVGTPRETSHLIDHFCKLLNAIHDAPDEAAALLAIAEDLLRSLDACTVVIRSAALARSVAQAGRAWPAEARITQAVLDGGGEVMTEDLTPAAAHPIVTSGSIAGAIAARWVPGARPPVSRVRELLRTAAAAVAPTLKSLEMTPVADASDAAFPDHLLGDGRATQAVRDAIRRAALVPFPVLIEGESGSGKELVARAIHARSVRRPRRFCAVNCAALTDELLEAELFGHARGSFTGAVSERPGLFEEADQGTIFLDEAGELTPRAQAKLLRVLQEGEIRRVGENLPRRVDARVVAATNRPLEQEVAAGRFRADLRFRLDVIRITLPPLRERVDELPRLALRIWAETRARVGSKATLGDDVLAAMARYDWPGNVRELQNVIAALAVHGPRRGRVSAATLPLHIARAASAPVRGFEQARLEFERHFIRASLARAGGRRGTAAAQLGVSRQGLAKMMKRLGIE